MKLINVDGRRLQFMLGVYHLPCWPWKWWHIKVHLRTYNHKVHYEFCLAEYMFKATCCSCNMDPFSMFIHTGRSGEKCGLVSKPTHCHVGSPLPWCLHPTPTTASFTHHCILKPVCLNSIENFQAVLKLYYSIFQKCGWYCVCANPPTGSLSEHSWLAGWWGTASYHSAL